MENKNVNVSEWINRYLHLEGDNIINIDGCKYADMFYFTILWNLFEARIFDHNMKGDVEEIQTKIENKIILTALQAEPIIDILLKYLQDRYIGNSNSYYRFEHLFNGHNDGCKTLLEDVLHGTKTDKKDIVTALIISIYRFRCNLFHGEKEIASLPASGVYFCPANRFIIACLKHKK